MRNTPAIRAPRGVRLLSGAIVLLFLALATHAATNVGGDGLDPLFQKWVNDVVPIGCAIVCMTRAWRVREERLAWLLVGLGIAFWAIGNVYYSLYVIDVVPLPIPSVADGLWLAQYPISLLAVLLLMRSRLSGGGVHVWLDGAIAGLALSGLSAAIVLPSALGASGGNSAAEVLTNLAYPICDMVLLGSLAGALAARNWRLGRMWTGLSLGFFAFIVTDGLFLIQTAQGTYVVGTLADSGWLLGGLLMAFAAWQPLEAPVLARRQGVSALFMPSLFGSVALVLLIWDHFERVPILALILSSASVAAVLARMVFAFSENLRMLARLRREAESLAGKNEQLLELKSLKEDLQQAQKMEALGQLAGGVAHDFNNLLTVVSGYTALLRPTLEGDVAAVGKLDAIATAADRANDLTRQLLTFSSKQVVEPSDVDLNRIVLETQAMIAATLGENIRLETELSDDEPTARAGGGQVSQVLLNLVLNARDSMPEGGTILIRTAGPGLEEAAAAIENGGSRFVTLTVVDTGTGMDEATQDRIFEPFFTTKSKGQGTGLGLATVYGIVEGAGGFLQVESTPGMGTSFRIALPEAAVPRYAPPASPPDGSPPISNQSVLLVEDEPAVRDLVAQQLERLGHVVTAAPTPMRAIELFEERGGEFDLVVTDVVMPRMNGWELAERLREHRADLPVVLMSGYTDGALNSADVVGSTAFLVKPFTIEALAAKVEAVTPRGELAMT